MESSLGPLLPLFNRERVAGRALALGLVLETAGSTYRKPGALMLIAANGEYAGLLSGGCLEGDLRQHAQGVIETGQALIVSYDLRGPDDLLWGLGLGCEGAMKILLMRAGRDNHWQPLAHLTEALSAHRRTAVGVVVESTLADTPLGTVVLPGSEQLHAAMSPLGSTLQSLLAESARSGRIAWHATAPPASRVFVLPLALPPRVLLLGAGPDALPVVDLAARVGWKVTVTDHRPAYAQIEHFPAAERVVLARAEELADAIPLAEYSAAVVMSHHLPSDLEYLRALSTSLLPYVGLLGPPARRERLLSELGPAAERLRARLHAPVGLALGGRAPESIALAIVAEIHAFVHGADGRMFSGERPLERASP